MRNRLAVIGGILLFALAAAAQDVPRMETFLGYTYLRVGTATGASVFSANGGSGQFAYNFNKWLGAVADLGAVHNNDINGRSIDNTMTNFLAGPRVSLRFPRLRPYFQVLFGGVYYAASTPVDLQPAVQVPSINFPGVPLVPTDGSAVSARIGAQQTVFALAAGGGLDIKVNRHLSFRPLALDYFMTRLQNLRTQGDNNQHDLRYTAGANFTFGGAR
jgi:hypothetical protein